jgi:hypothetical protein
MSEEPDWEPVLAEILLSAKTGLVHTLLVGELIAADARLNLWFLNVGKARCTTDEAFDIVRRVGELQARCVDFWRQFDEAEQEWRHREGLGRLTDVLAQALQDIRDLAPEAVALHWE